MTGGPTAQGMLRRLVDIDDMTVVLPKRNVDDLRYLLKYWPHGQWEVTVREILSTKVILCTQASVVSKHASKGGGGSTAWVMVRKTPGLQRIVQLTTVFMKDI